MKTTQPQVLDIVATIPIEKESLAQKFYEGVKRCSIYIILLAGTIISIGPFIIMITTSISPITEVFIWPPRLIPSTIQLENYSEAILSLNFGRYFINSLIVACGATAGVLIFDSIAGYAFAKLRFPGRRALFIFVLAVTMIPSQVIIIPLFLMFRAVPFAGGNNAFGQGGSGFLDSFPGLIVPFIATTFGTYLMREFFRMIPSDLLDAGRIDGCSEFKIFRRIYLPLAKPALATLGMLWFTESWNAFLWPLIIIQSKEMRTLQVGLSYFQGLFFVDWHLLMAAVVITSLPIFLIFLFGQKQFIRGVALSGIKG